MSKSATIALCLVALVSGWTAWGASDKDVAKAIDALLKTRDAEIAKGPRLRKKIEEEHKTQTDKEKELALWRDQIDKLLPVLRRTNAQWRELMADKDYREHQRETRAYKKAGCEGEMTKAKYAVCQDRKKRLDALWEKPNVGPRHERLSKAKKNLAEQIVPIVKRRDELRKEIATIRQNIRIRRKRYHAVRAKVERLDAQIRLACQSPAAKRYPAALKHCHSIDWDGARRNLPPLTDIRPPFKVTPQD